MNYGRKHRIVSALLAFVFIINMFDSGILRESLASLRANAASTYPVGFSWDTTNLSTPATGQEAATSGDKTTITKDGKTVREFTLDSTKRELELTEYVEDNPILKTAFSINPNKVLNAGDVQFTITGMEKLKREGGFTFDMHDPIVTSLWKIDYDKTTDTYKFTNTQNVTPNSVTRFTWQLDNSRTVRDGFEAELKTTCTVFEHEKNEDGDIIGDPIPVTIPTEPLIFKYHSKADDNQVKIVCEDLSQLDANNLNVDYNWRSYKSMLGLEGIEEYNKPKADEGVIYTGDDPDTEAHAVEQNLAAQYGHRNARGIKTSDYFIEVNCGGFDPNDILVVDENGDRVELGKYTIGEKTCYGFYDFRRKGDFKPGESYTTTYRVGVLNTAVENNSIVNKRVELTGHYLITYNDETTVQDHTDNAAHSLGEVYNPGGGGGDYLMKRNAYEINRQYYDNPTGITYKVHAKPPSPVNQLMYESVFNGKTVTYYLNGKTHKPDNTDNKYDLIYEDGSALDANGNPVDTHGALSIRNLDPNATYTDDNGIEHTIDESVHYLTPEEYDFTRVKVRKLVDGNTVGPELNENGTPKTDPNGNNIYKEPSGFNYDVYGKGTAYSDWTIIGSGNTIEDSEVFLPEGIDQVRVVVRDLGIDAPLGVDIDVKYNIDKKYYNAITIDTKTDGKDDKELAEDDNKGSYLRNEFTRSTAAPYSSSYTRSVADGDYEHSNTWLRESTTVVDSGTAMTPFALKTAEQTDPNITPDRNYETTITSSGKIYSDVERSLSHFSVTSKLPDGLVPDADWLAKLTDSFEFSGVLQGTGESIDKKFVLDNNIVSFYYDKNNGTITAEFNFEGVALNGSADTTVKFNYPAYISASRILATGDKQNAYTAETYTTVLDANVRLSAEQNKSLVISQYTDTPASKSSATRTIPASGSIEQNVTTKKVKSAYTDWLYDNSTEVDGRNTSHLDETTGRMTSEYSYELLFRRVAAENETLTDPMIVDVIEGLKSSAWKGSVRSITFGDKYYPDDVFTPHVYYLTNDKATGDPDDNYSNTVDYINGAINDFRSYENHSAISEDTLKERYNTLKQKIKNPNDGWKSAVNTNGVWTPEAGDADNIFAVAVIYEGSLNVSEQGVYDMKADLNMDAPALVDESDAETKNNRATYNEVHGFALRTDASDSTGAVYSGSNRTLVILRHTVELVKVSSKTQKRLTGAKFSIYTDAQADDDKLVKYWPDQKSTVPSVMKDMPVDSGGTLELNLSPGIYYYKETQAPQGYIADDNLYRFRVVSDSNAVYYYTVDLKDLAAVQNEYFVINNEEYLIYKNSVYAGKKFVDSSKDFHIYDSDGNTVTDFVRVGSEYSYNNQAADNEKTSEVKVNSDGLVSIKDLPAGTYLFATTPDDADGYYFSVPDKGQVALRVMQKSIITNVTYNLFEKTGSGIAANDERVYFTTSGGAYNRIASPTAEEQKDEKANIKPTANGHVVINNLDPTKEYYLVIVSSPEGFKRSNQSVMDISKTASIDKYAAEQLEYTGRIIVEDDPIEVASASFVKVDGTMIGGAPAGANGVALNGAEYEMYVYESDGSQSKVYFLFDVTSTSKNYRYMGTEGKTGWTSTLTSDNTEESINGRITVTGLPYGTYYVKETKAPSGFELSDKKYYFRVSAMTIDDNKQVIFDTENADKSMLELSDDEVLSSIIFEKHDYRDSSKLLENAGYSLYMLKSRTDAGADESLTDAEEYRALAENAVDKAKGNTEADEFKKYWSLVASDYTDSTGEIEFSGLAYGVYLVYESRAPIGYTWNNDKDKWSAWTTMNETKVRSQIIEINQKTVSDNSVTKTVRTTDESGNEVLSQETTYYPFNISHSDDRQLGEARLIKTSSGDSQPLADGSFTLYKVVFTDAEINDYLKDKVGLTAEEIGALSEDERKTYVEQMTAADVDVTKHVVDGRAVQGQDKVIEQGLSSGYDASKGSTATVSGLEWGVYYFLETKAPSGYQRDRTPYLFNVDLSTVGATIEVNMADDKIFGEVWLYKQDKDTISDSDKRHLKLFGAQFELYDSDDEKIESVPRLRLGGLTWNDGTSHSNERKEFLVKEFTVLSDTQIQFVITDDGETNYTVTVTYEKTADGKIADIIADENFNSNYRPHFSDPSGTYDDNGTPKTYKDDLRLAYYAVRYDDGKLCVYDNSTGKYRQADVIEIGAVTTTYVTADEGGRLNVRGLDWGSYYFRETVPPAGYGLSEDVLFSVNAFNCENQFLQCEDPKAQAAIIIDKVIPDKDYFKAYGEPTFMFKVTGLEATTQTDDVVYTKGETSYKKNGQSYIVSIHMTDTKGSALLNVPEGQYLIEELPVSRYECTGLSLIRGKNGEIVENKAVNINSPTSDKVADTAKHEIKTNFTAFCDLKKSTNDPVDEILTFHVEYKNEIKRYDNFSEVAYADNRIPGQEYVTSFKPIYTPLIPQNSYVTSEGKYTYTIDIAQALNNDNFNVVLTYNTGNTKELTNITELDNNIKFKTGASSPFSDVQFVDNKLILTMTEVPSALAGQTFSLNVGYAQGGLSVYDTNNTDMIRGSLSLTFGELVTDKTKRVILKNDSSNRSVFGLDADAKTAEEITYTKPANDPENITANPSAFPTLNVDKDYTFKYWYLLGNDGRPVYDTSGKLVTFEEEEDIKTYIFGDSAPSGVTLAADSPFNHPDKINTFTLQAEVEENKLPQAMLLPGTQVRDKMIALAGDKDNVIQFIRGNTIPSDIKNDKSHIISVSVNAKSTDETAAKLAATYPVHVYIWFDSETGIMYWGSDEKNPYMNPESSYMFTKNTAVGRTPSGSFQNLTKFEVNWNASLVTTFENMFHSCISLVDATNTYQYKENEKVSPLRIKAMFQGCDELESCSILNNLSFENMNTDAEVYKAIFYGNSSLSPTKMVPIIKTWDLSQMYDIVRTSNSNRNICLLSGATQMNCSPAKYSYHNGYAQMNNKTGTLYQCKGHKILITGTGDWGAWYVPDSSIADDKVYGYTDN